MAILTAIKILGIVLSAASIIGSERLSKVEVKLRERLQQPEKILFGENIIAFFLTYGVFLFRILLFVLVFLFLVYFSLGLTIPEPIIDLAIKIQLRVNDLHINKVLKIILCFVIALSIAPPISVRIPLSRSSIFLAMRTRIQIPLDARSLYLLTVIVFYWIITAVLRLISFPYLWLDKQVQKRKVESTLVVFGILLAISGELISYFMK